jgi:hypothetical protein
MQNSQLRGIRPQRKKEARGIRNMKKQIENMEKQNEK